jgi:hypothetical protein
MLAWKVAAFFAFKTNSRVRMATLVWGCHNDMPEKAAHGPERRGRREY